MGKIKLLDDSTIEKIAAGEVIERPSSIVKELVENSVDANSDEIIIEIKDGGKTYIRVTDNGEGIAEDDIELAFKRHSTSKLSSIEDLYRIKSLGFRGEALASICTVSKVEIITKTDEVVAGIHGIFEEGKLVLKEKIGCPKGTTIIVKDVFYNLPVRRKFLKSDLVESNNISNVVYRMALGNPHISFKFIKDNKTVLKTSKNNNLRAHIYSILGKEFSNNLIEINIIDNGIKIYGFISNNKLYRGNRSHQYLYINGRYVYNLLISNAIEKYYKSIIPLNRFPCFVLFIEIEPERIDVNIHPTKEEIKFSNPDEVLTVLERAVRDSLFGGALSVPKMNFGEHKDSTKDESLQILFNAYEENFEKEGDKEKDIIIRDFTNDIKFYNEYDIMDFSSNILYDKEGSLEKDNDIDISNDIKNDEDKTIINNNLISKAKPIGVIFNTYIIVEIKGEDKVLLIDQHAAHERILYEKYLKEYQNENIIQQQLIAAEIIELTNVEMNIFRENELIFKKLGFDVEEFGNNAVAIRAVPLIFGKPNLKELFFDILDNANRIKSNYDVKLEKIMKLACTKAIKSGDQIEDIEIMSLLKQLSQTNHPYSCPHGRPTVLEIKKTDIEKAFLRII